MKFCMMVGLPDVVTHAKLHGDRFGHFCVVGVKFQIFPLTLLVVLTTLWQCDGNDPIQFDEIISRTWTGAAADPTQLLVL